MRIKSSLLSSVATLTAWSEDNFLHNPRLKMFRQGRYCAKRNVLLLGYWCDEATRA